jgi:GDP-4-dehydro-6-deoxy-D-mannose reductase
VGHKPLDRMIDVNENGTRVLLESLRKNSCINTRVLITSSSAVYGDKGEKPITEDMGLSPGSNYSISKVRQEQAGLDYFSEYGIPVVISRAFNNIGPGEKEHMFISRIASQIVHIEKGSPGPLKIGPLHSFRDYLDTRDVVDAYIAIMEKGVPGEVYNVCSGEPVKIYDLFLFLIKNASVPVSYEVVAYDQKGNIPYQCGSGEKLKGLTGWQKKRDIYKTLLEILDYWRNLV